MAVITIGDSANDRASFASGFNSWVTTGSVANGTGVIDTFEIFCKSNADTLSIGTVTKSSTANFTKRDYEYIGNVTAGSKQTFSGKNCDVTTGDYLCVYFVGGEVERDTTGYSGAYYLIFENVFDGGTKTFSAVAGDAVSIYATGATEGGASVWLPFMKHHLIGGF